MISTTTPGTTTLNCQRLDARQIANHARWLKRLGAAKVAWGLFIGSSSLQIRGHQQRIDALRTQRAAKPLA